MRMRILSLFGDFFLWKKERESVVTVTVCASAESGVCGVARARSLYFHLFHGFILFYGGNVIMYIFFFFFIYSSLCATIHLQQVCGALLEAMS